MKMCNEYILVHFGGGWGGNLTTSLTPIVVCFRVMRNFHYCKHVDLCRPHAAKQMGYMQSNTFAPLQQTLLGGLPESLLFYSSCYNKAAGR